MIEEDLDSLFADAGHRGTLSVLDIDGPGQISLRADEPAYAASSFKIAVGLELHCQCADGELDPAERVRLPPAERTYGGQGLCIFEDEAEISLRDLAKLMLTISDNTATDAVIRRVTPERITARLTDLGLVHTNFACTIREHFDSIGDSLGFGDFAGLTQALATTASPAQAAELNRRYLNAFARPGTIPTTTAADMARLMRMIWRDEAGPAQACAGLRAMMGQQKLTRKIATGFAADMRIAAKSGTVPGLISNDIGVVTYPDGHRYAIAILTQALNPGPSLPTADSLIGTAAQMAVQHLHADQFT